MDHKIPISRGGPDCLDNMVCSCKPCNELKRDRTVEEFRGVVSVMLYNLMQRSPEYRAALRFGYLREHRKRPRFYFEQCDERSKRKR